MNGKQRDFDKEAAGWDDNPARVKLAADVASAIVRQVEFAPGMDVLCVADLDLDGGEFHHDNTGVFHFGFDRAALGGLFRDAGFSKVKAVTASEVLKPTRSGTARKFGVFLMVGAKAARNQDATARTP